MNEKPSPPPKFVPTLTEVVEGVARPTHLRRPRVSAAVHQPAAASATSPVDEAALIARVMQEVDVQLETTLQAAVAQVAREQVAQMLPLLQEEIERHVKSAVREALARQLT